MTDRLQWELAEPSVAGAKTVLYCPSQAMIGWDRAKEREGEGKQGGREGGRLTSFLSYFARTWTSFFTLTLVCSSRNTIQDEFFPKECDKLREREAGRQKDRGQIRTPPYTKVAWVISNLTKPAVLYCHCRFSMQNLSQSHASGPQSQGLLTKAAGGGYSSLPRFLIRCEGTRPVGGSERNTHKLRDDFREPHYTTTLTAVWAMVQWTKKVICDQIYCGASVLCCTLNASVKDLPPLWICPVCTARDWCLALKQLRLLLSIDCVNKYGCHDSAPLVQH